MTLRVGVIGAGLMGSRHAQNLAEHAGVEVVAIVDLDVQRATALAAATGARMLPSATDLIADTEVDAVVIASPHDTHPSFALRCIDAGKPVFCEKPLALTADEALRVVDAERLTGRRLLQLGFMREYDAAHRAVKDAVMSERIGEPVAFHGIHANQGIGPARPLDDVLAGSVSHDIHSARWLLGAEVASAFVRWVPATTAEPWSSRYVQVTLQMDAGQIATIECNADSGYGYEVEVALTGERGTVSTRAESGPHLTPGWLERFADAYKIEMSAWKEAAAAGEATGPSAFDGYMAQVVVDACIESAKRGQPVEAGQHI